MYNYLKEENTAKALKAANIAAGIAAGYENQTKFEMLKNDFTDRYN